jgi:hypothetical protein
MNEQMLDDMFSVPRNSVNFAQAFRQGKTILISTDELSLQHLSPVLGKFFISRIVNARLKLGATEKPPRVHLYFDECRPYVDDQIGNIFTTLRSNGVGAMVAFQQVDHMGSQVSTIMTNTAIKFMESVSQTDAKAFAGDMRTDADFIMAHGVEPGRKPTKTTFAFYNTDLNRTVSARRQLS